MMWSAGVETQAGERVSYLITNARARDKANRVRVEELVLGHGIDVRAYAELLRAAADEVLNQAHLE